MTQSNIGTTGRTMPKRKCSNGVISPIKEVSRHEKDANALGKKEKGPAVFP